MLGSKVGMGKTSVDAETNEIVRRFAGLEGQSLFCSAAKPRRGVIALSAERERADRAG
jgi:hypothetical protein